MHRHQLIAPMILLTLLTVAGCTKEAAPGSVTPTGAPVAVAPGAPPAVAMSGEKHVRLKKRGSNWETHHYVANADTILWKADSGFDIVFVKNQNPCVAVQSGAEDIYTSTKPTAPKTKHTFSCPILANTPGEYGFKILDNANETPHQHYILPITPCYGCYLELGSDD